MQYKTTTKLFKGQYQYKVVLVVAGAHWFRSGNMDVTLEHLSKISVSPVQASNVPFMRISKSSIKTQDDLDYAFKLQRLISSMDDFTVRVETPWVTVYTNNRKDVAKLIKLDKSKVKYISEPPSNTQLSNDTIIMPKVNFDFRVTLGKTVQNHQAFISWAEANKNLKLTKSCIRALQRDLSWGGTHFYVTGEKTLLMTKMHLGGAIAKVEKILKQ